MKGNRYVTENYAASWDFTKKLFCVGNGGDTHPMERLGEPFLWAEGTKSCGDLHAWCSSSLKITFANKISNEALLLVALLKETK